METSKEQAFVDTVQARSHQLYRIAMGLLHSSQDAEDAVSDAMEATWKNLWRIGNEAAIPSYLIRCTINAAKMELRHRHHTEPIEPYQECLTAPERGANLTDYLSGLKEKDRLLLILKYQEELPEAEIAAILRIPRGTVSSRLSRLVNRLRADVLKEES